MLVVGDVIGHDSRAAAAMGQVRGLLRGIAYATGHGPKDLLHAVDEAICGLEGETTATAVVARLPPPGSPGGTGSGRSVVLSWSSAGHPPPMVVTPAGAVSTLEQDESDLLLGVVPTTRRTEGRADLAPGSTVLLYTDGLVERRGVSLDQDLDRLRSALTQLHTLPLEQLCDALLARLLPAEGEDDVAVLAVRLHSA